MKRTQTSQPGLKHLAFFEALAENDEGTPAFLTATAGLLALRLVDHWMLAGPVMVEPESVSVRSVRDAIMAIPANDPQREVLLGLVNSMQTLREADVRPVLPRIFAYAGALERRGLLALAADGYQSVIRLGQEEEDGELLIDSYIRLGYCRRVLGALSNSEDAYATAVKVAKRLRQPTRVFRSQVGLAIVAMSRGNLPSADELLSKIVQESMVAGCRAEHAMALHAQSVVAQRRGDLDRAACLSFDALQLTDAPSERDRILGDIGAYFIAMERFDAARDALLVLEATTALQTVRWNARVNMLALAARSGEQQWFLDLRKQLEGEALPSETSVNYLIESARGFRRFGQPDLAAQLLNDARNVATEHGLNRSLFESEEMLSEVVIAARNKSGEIRVAKPDRAAHVVHGLRLMAEALAA